MRMYQRIRDLREDADLTQRAVADKLSLHLTQYRRYECGETEVPLAIAVGIARLYGVSLDYIAGLSEDKLGLTRSALAARETRLVTLFRKLSDEGQGRLLERAEFLLTMDAIG